MRNRKINLPKILGCFYLSLTIIIGFITIVASGGGGDDGDLSNGIQIPAQMHTLAEGVSIDFKQRLSYFPDDFQLRALMATGRSAGLWGGSRAIPNPGYAVSAMYTGLSITPETYALSVEEYDSDADGTVDSRQTYAYDTNGNRTMEERDMDGDGTVDVRFTSTYQLVGGWTYFTELTMLNQLF